MQNAQLLSELLHENIADGAGEKNKLLGLLGEAVRNSNDLENKVLEHPSAGQSVLCNRASSFSLAVQPRKDAQIVSPEAHRAPELE